MKRFILKSVVFVLPFAICFGITSLFYSDTEAPDLLRLGMIPNTSSNSLGSFDLSKKELFDKVSNQKDRNYQVLTIGDSFSEQAGYGYKNYLAEKLSVLHVDRFISKNQFQTIIDLINGDFFSDHKISYVILQGVERQIIKNTSDINYTSKLSKKTVDSIISKQVENKADYSYKVFSPTTLKFPLYFLPRYILDDNYLSNNSVYNVETTTTSLFSNSTNKLLFYKEDLYSVKNNNEDQNIKRLNEVVNYISDRLKEKNIKLMLLPAADKYDFYYDYIKNKGEFTKPLFFAKLDTYKKNYIYIDSKKLLSYSIDKDIYFFGDTHWSPIASKIIANQIINVIEDN